MNKTIINIIKALFSYLLTALILFFYLYVLLKANDYNVSNEYRMFYIDGDLKYYLPDDGMKEYTVNNEYFYTNMEGSKYHNKGRGWSNTVYDVGTWAIGNRSDMYFYISDIQNLRFFIKYNASDAGDNYLFVNGEKAGILHIDIGVEATSICDISIDAHFLKEGINRIQISPIECIDEDANNLLVYSIGLY